MIDSIAKIQAAVEAAHKCPATHFDSVPIVEMVEQKKVWDGVIEGFNLKGHPEAERCYAWWYDDGATRKLVTVLEISPVVSAHTALRAAIASGEQKISNTNSG